MKIHIKNGRLIDPGNGIDAVQDVYIAAGKIAAIGQAPQGFVANQEIDASGLAVCPGLVDLSARLREPGYEYKATLQSELLAAVAGGITSLSCPPDTDPVLDEPGLVEMLKHRAKLLNLTHVHPLGALTRHLEGRQLTEMCELYEAGCVGFTHANVPITDTQVMLSAMQYASTFGFTVWLRPEDACLAQGGVAHDGEVAGRLGLKGIPACAETIALATMLRLAEETGTRLHICRLSTHEGVELVAQAKQRGLPVTCDITINHLHLTEHDIGYFDSNCHLQPPLRSQRDRDALREGLRNGTIDALCSNHSPVDDDAKLLPFAEAEPGAVGLELLLPLTLKWAAEMNASLSDAIARITCNPAAVLGTAAGQLAPGSDADICIFDPGEFWTVEAGTLCSQGKNTPFLGLELAGRVRHTLVHGHQVYQK